MNHQVHKSSTGNPTYRGYVIAASKGTFMLCGQTYQTLEEATAEVDKIVDRNAEDICSACGYHVTRCRMTVACLAAMPAPF